MRDENRSKKVTYTVKGGEDIEVSRKVEKSDKPRIEFETLLMIFAFGTLWLMFVLMFIAVH